jgi:hypothetical protein
MMSPVARVLIHEATVRPNKAEALANLIHQLFNRRNLTYIPAADRTWLTVELVQSLRRQSTVYRTLSDKTSGPLPFGLGFLRVRDETIEPISDTIPVEDPELLVRLLSEYVMPGATLSFTAEDGTQTWRIEGENAVTRVSHAGEDTSQADQ